MHSITSSILKQFAELRNEDYAKAMAAYMKHNFSFYGIKTEARRAISQPFNAQYKTLDQTSRQMIFDELWSQAERECHQAAIDLAVSAVKKNDGSWLPFWEKKVITNSWWDSVDVIAPVLIGSLLINDPGMQKKCAWKWIESENIWLQRTAIIFQLKYRMKTNESLLYEMILARADSKEFFIRKAGGWALRTYGAFNALSVSQFIHAHQAVLSPLTIKEGGRKL